VPAAVQTSEVVLFELPTRWFAARLLEHVGTERFAWHAPAVGVPVIAVRLTTEEDDIAVLLRSVQSWLEEFGLVAIRFEVDGRVYVLPSRELAADEQEA
jgi:hypothetical protein